MPSFLRTGLVVLLFSALAPMAASAATVPGCTNPAESALNQYCETVPSPGGGQTPSSGLPSLATTLPARVDKQLTSGRGARSRRALLAVPAPASHRVNLSFPAISTAATSTFPIWLIIVLIAAALTLGGVAAARWRRHRSRPRGGATA
jgi:hypothetical protein